MHEIRVPQKDVNAEYLILVKWHVLDKDKVEAGDPICTLESTKSTIEIEAPATGFIRIAPVAEGHSVQIAELIAVVTESVHVPVKFDLSKDVRENHPKTGEVNISRKAARLADEYGIDPAQINKTGLIVEKDIRELIEEKESLHLTQPLPQEIISEVNPDFLNEIRRDEAFAGLSSSLKVFLYRQNGAQIGNNVFLARGVVLDAVVIHIEENVTIEENTVMKADFIEVGRGVRIGGNSKLEGGRIVIGDYSTISAHVKMDMSGGKYGDSAFICGPQCLLTEDVYVNTSRKVQLGKRVALSPSSKIFTHSYWQSVLDGYPALSQFVEIDDDSWIGAGAQLMPGSKIGKGVTIVSNSVVISTVENYKMAGGIPAKVLKESVRRPLSAGRRREVIKNILEEFIRYLISKKCSVKPEQKGNNLLWHIKTAKSGNSAVSLCLPGEKSHLKSVDIIVGFDVGEKSGQTATFDLSRMRFTGKDTEIVHELRNFLRHRGIRFEPPQWRFNPTAGIE